LLIGGIVAAACSPRAVYIIAGLGGTAVTLCAIARLRTADWSATPTVAQRQR
jgi:hypothetical protein